MTSKDKIRTEHVLGTNRVVQASKKIMEGRLTWCEHVMGRDEGHILRRVLRMDIPG